MLWHTEEGERFYEAEVRNAYCDAGVEPVGGLEILQEKDVRPLAFSALVS